MMTTDAIVYHVKQLHYRGLVSDDQCLLIFSAPYSTPEEVRRLEELVLGLMLRRAQPVSPS